MGYLGTCIDVGDVAVGIAQGLDVDELRVLLHGRPDGIDVVDVDECRRDSVIREGVGKEVVRSAVDRVLRHDMVALSCQSLDRVCDRGGSGGECKRSASALEGCDPLLKHILGRVPQPSVDVAACLEREPVGRIGGIREDIGSGLVDGYGPCVGRRVGLLLTDMKLHCLESVFLHIPSLAAIRD